MRGWLVRITCVFAAALVAWSWSGASVAIENETFGITTFPSRAGGIDRSQFAIPLDAGATFEDGVRVYNRTDQTVELAIYAADATANAETGTISYGFSGSDPEGIAAWIDLPRSRISLLPRAETIVHFRITVQNTNPSPDLAAIVVENRAKGLRADLAQREYVLMRTSPPGSPTTSKRVRPVLLRSPWVIAAILALIVAAALVWLGTRRARRPQEAVPVSGHPERPTPMTVPPASRPKLHRFGRREREEGDRPSRARVATIADRSDKAETKDETVQRPLLSPDVADEEKADEDPLEPIGSFLMFDDEEIEEGTAKPDETDESPAVEPSRDTKRGAKQNLNYIPLDDL